MSSITVERIGRRSYFRGNTFQIKDRLRAAGAHWDAEQKAWWIGSDEVARKLVGEVASAPELATYAPAAGEEFVAVGGNTYPARDRLRALGGQWDATAKVWLVPASQLEAANAAVKAAPAAERSFRPTSCKQCGARPNSRGWPRIYRSGVCSDCYRDDQPTEHKFTRADGTRGSWTEY